MRITTSGRGGRMERSRPRNLQPLEHNDTAQIRCGGFRYLGTRVTSEWMTMYHANVPALQAHVRTAQA